MADLQLTNYDDTMVDRDRGGPAATMPFVGAGASRSSFFGPLRSAGVVDSTEKPGVDRIPVTYKVKLRPVLNNRQQSYRENDLLFACNTLMHMTDDRHEVYNLQALNEMLEDRVRAGIGAAKTEQNPAKRMRYDRTGVPIELESVPVKLYDTNRQALQPIERLAFLGVAAADLTDNSYADAVDSVYHQRFHRMFSVIGKHYAQVPPVFLNADGATGEEQVLPGQEVGLWIGRVPTGFYSHYHRYDPQLHDEEPTSAPVLQVVPCFRTGRFPQAFKSRPLKLMDDHWRMSNNNAQFEQLTMDYYCEEEVPIFRNGEKTDETVKVPRLEHAVYVHIGTVVGVHGQQPVRAEKKLAIRSRRHWDMLQASGSYLEIQLGHGALGAVLPRANF